MPATNNKITFRKKIEIKNKRAEHDYYILQTYTAGIVLYGTEIKSIRAGKAGLTDTFCYIRDGEIWVKNMYVAEYFYGSIVPLLLYIDDNNRAKLKIALVRGKKEYDKRQTLREKEDKRMIDQKFKDINSRR